MEITIKVKGSRSDGKGYVAEVSGTSARYGFEREFLSPVRVDGGEATYELSDDKIYEIKDLSRAREHRVYYERYVDGKLDYEIDTKDDVLAALR